MNNPRNHTVVQKGLRGILRRGALPAPKTHARLGAKGQDKR